MENITWENIINTAPDIIKEILEGLKTHNENPQFHPEQNAYNHIKIVTERLIKTGDMDLIMAGFCHDLGKLMVAQKSESGDWNSAHGHEDVSSQLVLRYKDWIQEMGANPYVVNEIVKNHMKIKFGAISKKDQERLERYTIFQKLNQFTNADNMNRKWDLDEGLNLVKQKPFIMFRGKELKSSITDQLEYTPEFLEFITEIDIFLYDNRDFLNLDDDDLEHNKHNNNYILDGYDENHQYIKIKTYGVMYYNNFENLTKLLLYDYPENSLWDEKIHLEFMSIVDKHKFGAIETSTGSLYLFGYAEGKPKINLSEGLNLVKQSGTVQFDNVTVKYKLIPFELQAVKHNIKNPVLLSYFIDGEEIPDEYDKPVKHRRFMRILNSIFDDKIRPYFESRGYHLWIY